MSELAKVPKREYTKARVIAEALEYQSEWTLESQSENERETH